MTEVRVWNHWNATKFDAYDCPFFICKKIMSAGKLVLVAMQPVAKDAVGR